MIPKVYLHRIGASEAHPAHRTAERLFPRVDPLVLLQVTFQLESLFTIPTAERSFLLVHDHVRFQRAFLLEALPADFAGKQSHVTLHV